MRNKFLAIIAAMVVAITVALSGKIGEDVKNNEIVVNQVPFTGAMKYWTSAGFKWQWFGKITRYQKTQQLWFSDSPKDGGDELTAIPITFNDAGNGRISGSLRVKLPTTTTHLQPLQTDYPSMETLMNDLVRPTVNKVVYASGTLMSSFESYAEKKNDLTFYITDQLNHGVYKTITKEITTKDAISGEDKVVRIAELVANPESAGGYERQENSPFAYYGIEIGQLSISKIDYDKKIIEQISQQQSSNMSIQTAKVEAMAAKQKAIKAEEDGKANAAIAQWKQEEIKIVAVTKAQQEYEVAALEAKKANEIAKKILAEGKAEAEANRLKVNAGLTPQEAAEWQYKTTVGVAEAIAKSPQKWVPEIMVGGNGSAGGNSTMDAVGLNMLLEISNKITKK